MIYFFHHYELPVIIQQAQVQQILRLRTRQRHHQQQQAGNASGVANNNGTNQQPNDNANLPNNGQPNDGTAGPSNNHININNNNINQHNANRNVVIHIGNFFNQHMTATLIISRALNIVGAVRNVIANDIFGAAIFNNNNDNNLNNNNATGTTTSHIRINLTNLRRINLSGIQINSVERNDDRLDSSVGGGGGDNVAANNEHRTNENPDGNEIDADIQYEGETESTDECDNLLKKHVRSEEELSQQQQQQEPFKILNLNDVSEKDGDITFASVDDELPKAPTDKEIQAPNCHGDPDSISDTVNDSIVHSDEALSVDHATASPYEIDRNQDKSVDTVAGNHDIASSIVISRDSHKDEREQCAAIAPVVVGGAVDDKNNVDCPCPCIGAPTIASIEKFDSITEECNLNSTGDMVNESGSRSLSTSNDNECSNGANDNDSRRNICSSTSNNSDGSGSHSSSGNISDSSKDSSGNRLPIVSPFK